MKFKRKRREREKNTHFIATEPTPPKADLCLIKSNDGKTERRGIFSAIHNEEREREREFLA